jgi:sec-independent protein translocase protein TatA
MGGSEILLILLAVLVLFGADKLPEFARNLGKGLREIKKATDEIKDEITKHSSEVVEEIKEIRNQSQAGTEEIKKSVSDVMDQPYEDPYKDINKPGTNANQPG